MGLYLAGGLIVIVSFAAQIPSVLALVFRGAFSFQAAAGGGLGIDGSLSVKAAGITQGAGALDVDGTTTLESTGPSVVTLDVLGNDFTGPVSVVSASNATLVDTNALVLGACKEAPHRHICSQRSSLQSDQDPVPPADGPR